MSIDPTDITGGQSATLAWNTKYADTVTIEPGVGAVDAAGSLPVSPQEDTTYTLTAVGPGGTSTARAAVTVTWLAPTATISITPELLHVGESATLSWDSEEKIGGRAKHTTHLQRKRARLCGHHV